MIVPHTPQDIQPGSIKQEVFFLVQVVTIFLLALGLAMDAFAVSLGIGTAGEIRSLRGKIRLSAHFGIFQSGMTALGWVVGATIVSYIMDYDHWIALVLLGYVGINLIRAGLKKDGQAFKEDPSTGRTLVLLSFATSIDAFAVGLSIVFMNVPIFISIMVIGFIAFLLSAIGLIAGSKLGETFGKRTEIIGGLILIGIGVRVVITHLFP
jgi:manganese efflux pump family protein